MSATHNSTEAREDSGGIPRKLVSVVRDLRLRRKTDLSKRSHWQREGRRKAGLPRGEACPTGHGPHMSALFAGTGLRR